jgi:hypothetical protein
MPDPQPISWRSIVYGTTVVTADNQRAGEVREVLGSDSEDIFHGQRVHLGHQGRDVMVDADDVDNMFGGLVVTSLSRAELESLPTYDEQATYHLASVGWLRKHVGWERDARSDEEPG